jgi:DNA (cytosine-5)-methyltransferase 1
MININKPEIINFCESDPYAVKSYCAIHNVPVEKNLGDITKVSELPKCDFLTYGFPCQDISTVGNRKGIKQGTRSGLLYEVERLLEGTKYKPKFLLMENVKALTEKTI